MIGIELKFEVKDILMEGIKKVLLYSGRNIRLLPPLISEQDIAKVLETLDLSLLTRRKKNV